MSETTQRARSAMASQAVAGPHFHAASAADARPAADEPCTALLVARALRKTYRKGRTDVPVLLGVDLDVQPGEFVALVGQSGSGKTTLLHLLGLLDQPDAGEIWFAGRRIDGLPPHERDALRNQGLGMIFQLYHLLPELSTLENVLLPLWIGQSAWNYWSTRRASIAVAKDLLEQVGLGHRLAHKPSELSGGEMQRAAIARALVRSPQVLLADEPTGNLDPATGGEILALLRSLNRQQGLTIVMVTHDLSLARQADRAVRLARGQVEAA